MNTFLSRAIRIYAYLLRLYPFRYRKAFEEQMLLDFTDMAEDAAKKGKHALLFFCLHELFDFPANLLQIYLKEGSMITTLRSQPANLGLRSALLFGMALGFTVLANGLALWLEPRVENSMPGWLQGLSIRTLLDWTGFFLIGLGFGSLFAVLFGDRSRYLHYMLVGTLGWLLQFSSYNYLEYYFDFLALLSVQENLYLYNLKLILSGAMFGLIFAVAQSERREALPALAVYVLSYPIVMYLYVRLIFDSFIIDTSWRLAPLAILWLVLLGGIFAFARKYESDQQMTRLVIAGAIGGIVLRIMALRVAFLFIPPVPPEGFLYNHPAFWPIVLILMTGYIVFGILFGFLLGWVLGIQRNNPSQPVLAEL